MAGSMFEYIPVCFLVPVLHTLEASTLPFWRMHLPVHENDRLLGHEIWDLYMHYAVIQMQGIRLVLIILPLIDN